MKERAQFSKSTHRKSATTKAGWPQLEGFEDGAFCSRGFISSQELAVCGLIKVAQASSLCGQMLGSPERKESLQAIALRVAAEAGGALILLYSWTKSYRWTQESRGSLRYFPFIPWFYTPSSRD